MRAQEMLTEIITRHALPQGWESETVHDLALTKTLLGKEILIRGGIIVQHEQDQLWEAASLLEDEQDDLLSVYTLLVRIVEPPLPKLIV